VAKAASRVAGKFLGPYFAHSSIARTATYLIMSHDSKWLPQESTGCNILMPRR
jgi:hypothetical protein